MLPDPVVIAGLGQLGTLFAEGFLRLGHPVIPITRNTQVEELENENFDPRLTLLCVGEDDWSPLFDALPARLRARPGLVSNELRAPDLEKVANATTIIVWFERKRGMPPTQVRPSIVAGPEARLASAAMRKFAMDSHEVTAAELPFELASKNLYILGLNLGGLLTRSENALGLITTHEKNFLPLLEELIELETVASGVELSREALQRSFFEAIEADPKHGALGRSAPLRLKRTLELGRHLGLTLPRIEGLPRG